MGCGYPLYPDARDDGRGVDKIDGVRRFVLKDIEGLSHQEELFQGGAVMGDGSIAMIVDNDRMAGYEQV